MNERNVASYLRGTVNGSVDFFKDCFIFFTADKLNLDVSNIWLPYKGRNQAPINLKGIKDKKLYELVKDFSHKNERLYELVKAWTESLLSYFDFDTPANIYEWHEFRELLDKHRKISGPSWMEKAFSQKLESDMREGINELSNLLLFINRRIEEVYKNKLIAKDEIGDQRAKDLIDIADEKNDHTAITLLKKALTYGESGIQASKAYISLGMRYENIGEIELAIDAYSRALTAWKPFASIHFWRGKLYYQLQKLREAKQDFEQALNFPGESGLREHDQEEAKKLISKLQGI